ncbi:hypothetical protein CCP3SC1_700004 [Gammaproteobacteria bacterium]
MVHRWTSGQFLASSLIENRQCLTLTHMVDLDKKSICIRAMRISVLLLMELPQRAICQVISEPILCLNE